MEVEFWSRRLAGFVWVRGHVVLHPNRFKDKIFRWCASWLYFGEREADRGFQLAVTPTVKYRN